MKFHEYFIFTLDLTGASESIYFEDWPVPWLLLKRKGVFNLRTVPEGKLWMMHLICLPLWFITVDFSTVLQCLKIDPQWKPGNLCHCSHLENDLLSFQSSSIVFFFWHSQTFWLLPLCLSSSSSLLLFLIYFPLFSFFNPASLWRGALSLLSSGHFKEAEQTQCTRQTATPKRQQGKYMRRDAH